MPAGATHPVLGHVLRVDPQHHTLELMQAAVASISAGRVKVRLSDEQVFLTGDVASWHQKQHAQECIRNLSSGRVICNSLEVRPTAILD
ncbi:MAG: BON domain-containing protein [Fuerstiella sp.]